jgi:hypothetical protein
MSSPGFPNQPVLEGLQVAPPYCDLWVQDVVTKPDHDNQRLNVCAVIANRGQAPPGGPILVHFEVSADRGSQPSTHEWRWYHAGTALPFRTDWMWAPLQYVEDGGGWYHVHVTVGDPENLAGDRNPYNNVVTINLPPIFKPHTFTPEMNQPLRVETRIENGEHKSALTIGGKPPKR